MVVSQAITKRFADHNIKDFLLHMAHIVVIRTHNGYYFPAFNETF